MTKEEVCINPQCRHLRRVHSKNGCGDFDMEKMQECKCKAKYMDKHMFR
jgi:hypothetical protein